MSDIIHLLPDSVANQIAAGEVIQRPASVVKELVENAIDAGSTKVTINIKDAGKTLIQIIDNGCGMSDTDARMAFERHATSKISKAKDLFAIRSLGFRGEALASIAAIAYVDLKTKLTDQDIGTHINVVGSEVKEQKNINCPSGSNFLVKNLFFNVPARRKFLKTNSTELRHIINEFQHIALAYPKIKLSLIHNDVEIYNLAESNLKQRIVNLIGKGSMQSLLPIESSTSVVNINGFIGKPENARKTTGEQFFFVNGRYMRNPYMYKAVMNAYEKILAPASYPSFFVYFDLDPGMIDINIHPTKTEIKFADEKTIWQILHATLRESLGKFNLVPSLEFDQSNPIEITTLSKDQIPQRPQIEIDPNYNPFEEHKKYQTTSNSFATDKRKLENWESLFVENENFNMEKDNLIIQKADSDQNKLSLGENEKRFLQIKNKYILSPIKSGLMIIDQKRAHERILFEKFLQSIQTKNKVSQISLFPKSIKLNPGDFEILVQMIPDLSILGFEITVQKNNTIKIKGIPADLNEQKTEDVIYTLIDEYKNIGIDMKEKLVENLCINLACNASVNYGQKLSQLEINNLFDMLFACKTPNFSPSGKPVISIINNEEIEKRF